MNSGGHFILVSIQYKHVCVAGPAAALVALLEKGLADYWKPGSVFSQDKDKEQPEVFMPHNSAGRRHTQFLLAILNLCESSSSGCEVVTASAGDSEWNIVLRKKKEDGMCK